MGIIKIFRIVTMKTHQSISEFIDQYDAFLLDIWGVIHDGQDPYPQSKACLEVLQEHGKKVILLSNAPRRAAVAAEKLTGMGFSESLYQEVITSGEVTFEWFKKGKGAFFRNTNKYFYEISPDYDAGLLNGLDYTSVDKLAEASFILAIGFDSFESTLEEKIPLLEKARRLKLPMVCTNPDLEIVRQDGSRMLCAGMLGQAYEEMGGKVTYIGKPYPLVYQTAIKHVHVPKDRVIAIGDNLLTDIKGANQAGIDNAFVAGGILAETFNIKAGELPDLNEVDILSQSLGVKVERVLPVFKC